VKDREEELGLVSVRAKLEIKVKMLDESAKGMFRDGKDKTPLEEVKDTHQQQIKSISDATPKHTFPGLETPVNIELEHCQTSGQLRSLSNEGRRLHSYWRNSCNTHTCRANTFIR
jgi:hypothetical protein